MAVNIKSFAKVVPMIYAYNTPGIPYHEGWIKIGYTEKQTVEQRIKQQTHTANIKWELQWKDNAMYKDGSGDYFTDKEFHNYLEIEKKVTREPDTEWFEIDKVTSNSYFDTFAERATAIPDEGLSYDLREEQSEAVRRTKEYFVAGGKEFLWNAKPRFGKTLTSYDLIQQLGFNNILIVTNRPSIANSWAEDFNKYIGWRNKYSFVSDTDALKGKAGVVSREEYTSAESVLDDEFAHGMIAFESLQGLKGSVYFGGDYRKLAWMANEYTDGFGKKQHGLDFDLLIIDEAQEGVDTMRTDRAFQNISRKHTLYLSGTPFKALASGQFSNEQIYNWSYADEQEKKEKWDSDEYNPYESLPKLEMYTYQLSNMIYDQVQKGLDLSGEDGTVDYAFDLNEFFATNDSGKFIHESEIIKFLKALFTLEKYPFSTTELRKELSHTLWLLNRVDSCKALAKILNEDDMFREYKVVLAAGDGRLSEDDNNEKSFDKVKREIAENDKTITLSVGQLTVGITIPEWSGVLMLCNMKSPSSYMQAAFRAQNPCIMTIGGQRMRKETAYVFDFDPARTLIIFDEFANNLLSDTVNGGGTGEERKENIRRLLNFFPVLGEDDEGKMIELDAAAVLSIPRKLKSQEVVRHGFMSNFLFQNISNIFGAPAAVKEIVEKLAPAHEESGKKKKTESLQNMRNINVDENGDVEVSDEIIVGQTQDLFGEKIYETISNNLQPAMDTFSSTKEPDKMEQQVKKLVDSVKETIKQNVVSPVVETYDLKKGMQNKVEKQIDREIEKKFENIQNDYVQQTKIAEIELERLRNESHSSKDIQVAESAYKASIDEAMKSFIESAQKTVKETIEEKPQELVERIEKHKAEEEKHTIEDDIRSHLRGFARTIPSFIMAYGDMNLKLANFDDYTEDDVFFEVTGITEDEFRFLRDGGEYTNSDTGEQEYFSGHLFDEIVFDDSISEFWNKKIELANYFDDSHEEDIFDYIPPQKTNQIFTPRWIVSKMVEELEENNPGCFDDPTNTFADLYMKSGLYITEIVKKLFSSEKLKDLYPNDQERIKHILRNQVYGMAPTRIIYLIATNYILGFDDSLKHEVRNFVQADAAEAASDGTLAEIVNKYFQK